MLYLAIYQIPGTELLPVDIIYQPEIRRYVENWGRFGDLGFVVEEEWTGRCVGAIWMRVFDENERGYGYISPEIPELAMSVVESHRGLGIGTMMMGHLLEEMDSDLLSLSVYEDNPALRLYKRFGFREYARKDDSIVMWYKKN